MRTVRICQLGAPLNLNDEFTLDEDGYGHLIRVLRFTANTPFVVFDGIGNEYEAVLTNVGKKASFKCLNKLSVNVESPLFIELGQVISRGDKMEFTIQKAVE